VLFAPNSGFATGLAVVVLAGAWEWAGLIPTGGTSRRVAYVALLAALLGVLARYPAVAQPMTLLGVAWWLLAGLWLAFPGWAREARPVKAVTGTLVLLPCWVALVALHAQDPVRVLFLLGLIWTADIGAYFVGKGFGQRKLAPRVSPGKTWAGTWGGLILSLLFATGVGLAVLPGPADVLKLALLCGVTVAFSGIGDLSVSLMKRHCGVKDSGKLLPGHGGVLDRLDSLFAAAPVFAVGTELLGL
jgi:phosphatidate cytidylyltransferase